jgi:dimethylargininase
LRVFDFNAAIVRLPGRSVVDGLRAQGGPSPVFERVVMEHGAYVDALRRCGLDVTVLEPLEPFPDSMFVEDPALVFGEAAVLLRPGAPSRLGEAAALAPVLATHFSQVLQLKEGYVDGGDILVTPSCVFIGLSARTDEAGAAALQSLLATLGRKSRVVRTPPATLHLKSDCSLVDEQTVLATGELASSGLFDEFRVLTVHPSERPAVNAVRVNDVMLIRNDSPRTADQLSKLGVAMVPLPVGEISRIDAGLSCMSLRWHAD